MIIVKLKGGTGNQMFQYAIGRLLAIKNNDTLKIDISDFGKDKRETLRKYELDVFNVKAEIADINEINRLKETNIVKRVVNRLGMYWGSFIAEKTYDFDERVLALQGGLYLDGFWQSWKYFKEIEGVVRDDFTFKIKPLDKWSNLIRNIKERNSISIHVRRQDYVGLSKTSGIDYYIKAIEKIKMAVDNPYFIFFSDDISWVKDNLKIKKDCFYVEGNFGKCDYEDMRLMSLCKHNIIANSSFSWWGAWLNNNPKKIVIYPKKWFNDGRNVDDLAPSNWIGI